MVPIRGGGIAYSVAVATRRWALPPPARRMSTKWVEFPNFAPAIVHADAVLQNRQACFVRTWLGSVGSSSFSDFFLFFL
jgi:soluble lytic murein transglycosylase-like protein